MRPCLSAFLLIALGCGAPRPSEPQPPPVPPSLEPLEDMAEAKRQALAQNKPLLVLSVLGDYQRHC